MNTYSEFFAKAEITKTAFRNTQIFAKIFKDFAWLSKLKLPLK